MSGKGEKGSVQELLKKIEEHFGIPLSAFENYRIYERKKGEFWIASGDPVEEIPCSRWGLRFATVFPRGGFRLSTSAVQIFGKLATKNVVEVSREEMESFIRGMDLANRWESLKGQVIVRYKGIPLGSGVVTEGIIKNQIPTARRIRS